MIERELKYLLPESEFRKLYKWVNGTVPYQMIEETVQVNYYYDTPELKFHKHGVTLRVRQKEGKLVGQIKRHDSGASFTSAEDEFQVSELQDTLEVAGTTVTFLGSLMTKRQSFISIDGWRFDFDENYYLGRCDYELEIEFEKDQLDTVREMVTKLGLKESGRRSGKFSRFLEARAKFMKNC